MAASTSSSSAISSLRRRLVHLSTSWPVDPLRPSFSFGKAISQNLGLGEQEQQHTTATVTSGVDPKSPSAPKPASGASAVAPPPAATASTSAVAPPSSSSSQQQQTPRKPFDERIKTEQEMAFAERAVKALEGIREGKESHEHPLPRSLLSPKSDPEYYNRLRSHIDRLSKGENVQLTWGQKWNLFMGRKPI